MSSTDAPAAVTAPPPLVSGTAVVKTFGAKRALDGATFSVAAGRICGLLGPNGSGKTTLMRLMMGILKATSGTLKIDGLDAFADRVALKRRIGYVPDEPVFHTYLSGREILELSAAMHGLAVPAALEQLRPLAHRMQLADELDNFADDYSRGMKKKLALLLALLHRPKLLILDEPTNGLDVEGTLLFYDLMTELAGSGTTVLFSTHLLDQVVRLCSRVIVIHRGEMVAQGSVEELRTAHGRKTLEETFRELTQTRPAG